MGSNRIHGEKHVTGVDLTSRIEVQSLRRQRSEQCGMSWMRVQVLEDEDDLRCDPA